MCIFDDTVTIDARALLINPDTEYIFVYEIDKKAIRPEILNAGFPLNYVQEEIIEE